MDITVGATYTHTTEVTPSQTARVLGSGLVDVFATPMMIAFMELAASECIRPFLAPGQGSVGTSVNVTHDAATPVGMKVTFTATVTAADRRRVDFHVEARDEAGKIGGGDHSRAVIDTEKFMARVEEKRSRC